MMGRAFGLHFPDKTIRGLKFMAGPTVTALRWTLIFFWFLVSAVPTGATQAASFPTSRF
jgi:hypothetical protein